MNTEAPSSVNPGGTTKETEEWPRSSDSVYFHTSYSLLLKKSKNNYSNIDKKKLEVVTGFKILKSGTTIR